MRASSVLPLLLATAGTAHAASPAAPGALELIRKSDWQSRGKAFEANVLMRIVRGKEIRTLEFFLWAKGTEKAVAKVLAPARDRAVASLRRGTEFWSYAPAVERVRKLPPSMMKQAWMGGDFTNGDLVRATNLARHYDHRLVGQETRDGHETFVVESQPHRGAPVDPGKIVTWLTKGEAAQLRQELYDGNGKLERVVVTKAFRPVGERRVPTTLVVTKAGETGFTQIDYRGMRFDRPLDDLLFTQEFLKKRIEVPELPRP